MLTTIKPGVWKENDCLTLKGYFPLTEPTLLELQSYLKNLFNVNSERKKVMSSLTTIIVAFDKLRPGALADLYN